MAAAIRTLLRLVNSLLGYAVAFITVLVPDKRQRLGDMAARTLVVRGQVVKVLRHCRSRVRRCGHGDNNPASASTRRHGRRGADLRSPSTTASR
jgi:hypothetical protein